MLRKRTHSYSFYYSVVLLDFVNLCLIYKLNFTLDMYVQGKKKTLVYIGFSTICRFRHSLDVWEGGGHCGIKIIDSSALKESGVGFRG
jgi:hypothetical protein